MFSSEFCVVFLKTPILQNIFGRLVLLLENAPKPNELFQITNIIEIDHGLELLDY